MFKVPNRYRVKHPFDTGSTKDMGNNGAFNIQLTNKLTAVIMASDGAGWEHVSVSLLHNRKRSVMPTWSQMCKIKSLFWDDEDTVIQYHPAKSDYVNNHPNCLHLWRPTDLNFPIPPSLLVGIKGVQF